MHEFIGSLNHGFRKHFLPNQEIRVDESMFGIGNHCIFIQFMANKHHARFSIKKSELSDLTTGYFMQSALYSGKRRA